MDLLEKTEDEISSSGYVINSMEAALWALANSKSFKEGVLKAVNLGNDSDTVQFMDNLPEHFMELMKFLQYG